MNNNLPAVDRNPLMPYFRDTMKIVLQRVKKARVTVYDNQHPEGYVSGEIASGLALLVGFKENDNLESAAKLAKKVIDLRIFEDENGKMNKSVSDIQGELLIVSQFTLYGDTRKGRRPSFTGTMPPDAAEEMYLKFVQLLTDSGRTVKTGVFGTKMDVEIINDGPVTFILEDPMP